MMRYFGCNDTVLVVVLCLVLMVVVEEATAGLLELTSRDEVVQTAGYGEEKLSTVLITGSLHCESHAAPGQHQPHPSPIPGARVGVKCERQRNGRKGKGNNNNKLVGKGVTDEFGDFIVDLPSYLHAIPNLENICTVKLHRIPNGSSLCHPSHHHHVIKKPKRLTLSSFGNGIRTYSAGNIRIIHQ